MGVTNPYMQRPCKEIIMRTCVPYLNVTLANLLGKKLQTLLLSMAVPIVVAHDLTPSGYYSVEQKYAKFLAALTSVDTTPSPAVITASWRTLEIPQLFGYK